MVKRKEKVSDVVYTVQSDMNRYVVYNFTERPILCEIMSKVSGVKWSKNTLDYHFTKKKEDKFSYRGYTIFMRHLHRGRSRGRYIKNNEEK